jgi:hypothetical protein
MKPTVQNGPVKPDSPLYRALQMVARDVENNEPLKSISDASRCPERAQKSGGWCSQAVPGATHDSQSDHRISRDQRTAGCSFTGFSWNRLRHPDYGLQSRVLQERNM